MLRIPLLGRTGNNLFQYAFGRAWAERHGAPFLFDASWFNSDGWAEVSHFLNLPIKANVRRHPSLASRALRKFTGKHYWEYLGGPVIREKADDHRFDPGLLNAPADSVIFGYFQSPLYFESISGSLREELNALISESLVCDADIKKRLQAPYSVAVHVRRGDFLTQPVFQVCGYDYYQNAISHLRTRVPGAQFFIFSDEPDWCRANFNSPDTEVVESNAGPANPLHDLYLMSLASHQIIANSTYSWWAAWLGKKDHQEVVMPDRWFASEIIAPVEEKKLPHWKVLSCG